MPVNQVDTEHINTTGLTPTQREIVARLGDEEWRIDNLYSIRNKRGQIKKFVRNISQMAFWKRMWWLNVILKDRQRGFSTLSCVFILDRCMWNPNTQAGIIDLKMTEARKKLDKITFAFDHLPKWIQALNPILTRSAEHVKFRNGSEIWVSTSHRGGTLEILFISELGPIASRNPTRAREIVSGALNALPETGIGIIESTAEGHNGVFFDMCENAQKAENNGTPLTYLDMRFHFFGWWMDGQVNEMDPTGTDISPEMERYFNDLEVELGIIINARKRAWYVRKERQQGSAMHREFPSTADEAFHAPIEGSFFAAIISKMRKDGNITPIAHDPRYPVNTGWDLGIRDYTTIWLHQRVALQDRLIGYIEGPDKDILHYWRLLCQDYSGYTWGHHFLPHDAGARRAGTGSATNEYVPKTLEEIANEGGMRNTLIVPRTNNSATAIQEVKLWLPQVFVDPTKCAEGLSRIQDFRRQWDANLEIWKGDYRHDLASHGYKGLECLARGLSIFGADHREEVAVTKKRHHRRRLAPAMDWRIA